jgi:hypothetical protein
MGQGQASRSQPGLYPDLACISFAVSTADGQVIKFNKNEYWLKVNLLL